MQQNTQNGFTLIELMIVVAVVGVLARIAYPSYQDSVIKSKRANAKAALLELSVWMERYYTVNGCYTSGGCAAGNTTLPPDLTANPQISPFKLQAPKTGTPNYILSVAVTPSTFTLTATPQANTPDKCGALTLDNTGVKSLASAGAITVTGSGATATAGGSYTASYCWTGN
jgi:type IV pilus assembly protein PilE